MMQKFKVGDKVMINPKRWEAGKDNWASDGKVGFIYTLKHVLIGVTCNCFFENEGHYHNYWRDTDLIYAKRIICGGE